MGRSFVILPTQLAQLDDDRMKRRLTYKQVVVVWVCVVLAFGMVVSTAMMHTVSPVRFRL